MDIPSLYQHFLKNPTISTDSRKISPGSIFFALQGERFNGNHYITAALQQGASLAIGDEGAFCDQPGCIQVHDVLTTLQQLARYHRQQFDIPVIGITGTNGKTTTKELVTEVLRQKFSVVSTQGNLNNQIGVPLTLLDIRPETQVAVIEMGANQAGEIASHCQLAQPTAGLITSIGKAHLEGFGDIETIIRTKKALYDYLASHKGTLFVAASNPLLRDITSGCEHRILYGMGDLSDYPMQPISENVMASVIFSIHQHDYPVVSKLVGRYNQDNLMGAIAIGLHYGVSPEDIVRALQSYTPTNNRSQWLVTSHNQVILDAYNANPSSMEAAITDFLTQPYPQKALILGDMLELGNYEEEEHLHLLKRLETLYNITVFLIGPVFYRLCKQPRFHAFPTADALADYLKVKPLQQYLVLVKGSRGIHLETAAACL